MLVSSSFARSRLQVISPHASLRFERDLVLGSRGEVAFLAVDVSWHPITRDQIQPPAVHVEVISVARRTRISAVQPHDVEVLVLNPDAAEKASASSVFFRRQIEHQAAHVAQELAPRVVKIVVLPVKVVAVGEDHPGKAQRLVLELELLREPAQKMLLHALVFVFAFVLKVVAAVDRVAQVHAPQEVMIVLRNRPQLRILRQVLQIGLHNGSARRQKLDQVLLPQDHAVDYLIHGGRRRQIRRSLRSPEPERTALCPGCVVATGCWFCGADAGCWATAVVVTASRANTIHFILLITFA